MLRLWWYPWPSKANLCLTYYAHGNNDLLKQPLFLISRIFNVEDHKKGHKIKKNNFLFLVPNTYLIFAYTGDLYYK